MPDRDLSPAEREAMGRAKKRSRWTNWHKRNELGSREVFEEGVEAGYTAALARAQRAEAELEKAKVTLNIIEAGHWIEGDPIEIQRLARSTLASLSPSTEQPEGER